MIYVTSVCYSTIDYIICVQHYAKDALSQAVELPVEACRSTGDESKSVDLSNMDCRSARAVSTTLDPAEDPPQFRFRTKFWRGLLKRQ